MSKLLYDGDKFNYEILANLMDEHTKNIYSEWVKRNSHMKGIYHPIFLLSLFDDDRYPNKFWIRDRDFKNLYLTYKYQSRNNFEYAEAYKILAFTIYGYGNFSNNDRRRNRLHALRVLR